MKYLLLPIVFITGAASLIIEVTAMRILSPYFGNTLYTVSSVISVFLAALSLGYFSGGRIADKYPNVRWFYVVILAGGLSVLFVRIMMIYALPSWGNTLNLTTGPIIISLLLFFLPGLFLGILSPFAIRIQMQHAEKSKVGKVSGEVFFWSTFGSIAGSLLAGFFLIPRFGTGLIIEVVAMVLLVLGGIGLILIKLHKVLIISIIFFLAVCSLTLLSLDEKKENLIYAKDGLYEKIIIFDGNYKGRPTRFFRQDKSSSGAMFLDSNELVYDYTKYYKLYKLFKPTIKTALVLGGGAYSVPKALLNENKNIKVDVVEIEPSLFDLTKKYFRLRENARLQNYTEDGRRFLQHTNKKYDLIFSDVYYSLYSIPSHFTSKEFFQIAENKLNSQGVFMANFIGNLSRKKDSLLLSEIKTFRSIFSNSYFFAVSSPSKIEPQNIIFVGYKSVKKVNVGKEWEKKLIKINRFNLADYPELTDYFAPIEYLTAKVVSKSFASDSVMVDGQEVLALINQQLNYGQRFLGSQGNRRVQEFLLSEMKTLSDKVELQEWTHKSSKNKKYGLKNIIARFYPDKKERIILGTHYDTKRNVPGANDGTSGVATLIEVSRLLANTNILPRVGVDIVFFDGEEGEVNVSKTDWVPLGSTYFSKNIDSLYPSKKPLGALIVDMVCDKDLNIYKEKSSLKYAKSQVEKFWGIGKAIAPRSFSDEVRYEIRDDHTAFNEIGIPAFLVIDFDYPYFHTMQDAVDKCSAQSLEDVGNTIIRYLYSL